MVLCPCLLRTVHPGWDEVHKHRMPKTPLEVSQRQVELSKPQSLENISASLKRPAPLWFHCFYGLQAAREFRIPWLLLYHLRLHVVVSATSLVWKSNAKPLLAANVVHIGCPPAHTAVSLQSQKPISSHHCC